tara:strand:+ start:944 stop:1216 length:273 start_codon:yes stop_codon:yes gene_type:complete
VAPVCISVLKSAGRLWQRRSSHADASKIKEKTMLGWAITFFIVAIVAALFGFGGIASGAAGIAKILFFIFLVLFVIALVSNAVRGRGPKI